MPDIHSKSFKKSKSKRLLEAVIVKGLLPFVMVVSLGIFLRQGHRVLT
jgi:hypothetical protein